MSGPVGVPEPGIGLIDELATALMDQWAESEPEHSITKNPVSYVATFVELARAAYLIVAPRVRAEREAEIAGLIRKNAATLDSFARDGSTAGLIAYLIDNVMATPEDMGGAVQTEPGRPDQDGRDREPDWRAIAGQAVEALRLTREYVEPTVRLPAYPGWSWFDATNRYLTASGQPTMPAEPADPRPHSRACGPREHPHGPQCAADCRTCSAEGAR